MPKYLLLSFGRTSATLEKPGRLGGRGEGGRREGGREGGGWVGRFEVDGWVCVVACGWGGRAGGSLSFAYVRWIWC